jgi:hypothetical protein
MCIAPYAIPLANSPRGPANRLQLVMNDEYLPGTHRASTQLRAYLTSPAGAAVLAHSLRDAGTKKRLAVLVTLDSVSADAITELKVCELLSCPGPN